MKRLIVGAGLALAVLVLGLDGRASGAPPPGGVTLAKGASNVTATVEASLNADKVTKPFSLAPDVAYGVSDDLTVSLVHSGFATTGFRGNAGRGLCLAGSDGGCAEVYNNVGLEALYALARWPLGLAANAGVHLVNIDKSWTDVKIGLKGKYAAGSFAIAFAPSVFVGVNARDDGNKGSIWVPVAPGYKVGKVTIAVGTGIKGPLSGFGDGWTVAFVPNAAYAASPKLSVGGALAFPNLVGSGSLADDVKGFNTRFAQVWVGYTI